MRSRAYSNNDYNKVREFLNEVYLLNGNQHSWLMARWEYAEYYVSPLYAAMGSENWISTMRLWFTEDYKLVGIIHSENPNSEVFIQIHPDYRDLEPEMLDWAEENIGFETEEGKQIMLHCHEGDKYREDLLNSRGYKSTDNLEYLNWQSLDCEIKPISLGSDYEILSSADEYDLESKIKCIASAFGNKDSNTIVVDSEDLDIFGSVTKAPMYRKDLELYTRHSSGTMSSYALVWYNPITKTGMYEPVATNKAHQKKGLGKAVLIEGLRRLKELGATKAYVGSADDNRKAFYSSAGFTEYDIYRKWVKKLG